MSKKEKTYDKPMKGESAKSFKKYKIYESFAPKKNHSKKLRKSYLKRRV